MDKKKEIVTKEIKDMGKDKTNVVKLGKEKEEAKFVDVSIQILGELKGKKFVALKDIGFSNDRGNIFVHLDEKHTLLLKSGFMSKHLKLNVEQASEVEKSIMTTPTFEGNEPVDSKVRLKVLGERDGKVFVGPKGPINYDSRYKGLKINLDDQHVSVIDGPTLNRQLGIKITPQSLEKSYSLAR
ncbi:MAG: hypothetical protein K2Q26_12600 [Bdellovibrionales bacterium]|nr:hypothetical protein [Bdellovibrionales bacterium]